MSTYFTSNKNFQNDCVSPITPPAPIPSSSLENPFVLKYLRSSLPSDYSSPYLGHPIMNYYRGNITGSGGSSSGSNRTPLSPLVRMEEDMLVMDGVLIEPKSSSNSSGSLYKTELCKSWEDSGYCRYGSKCRFAHGQEELRSLPSRQRNMKKLEQLQVNKPKLSPSSSSAGPRNAISPNQTATTPGTLSASTTQKLATTPGTSLSSSTSKPTNPSPLLSKNWCPLDDGITISLPGSTDKAPTTADVDRYINNVLYGSTSRKRLPVFLEICPD